MRKIVGVLVWVLVAGSPVLADSWAENMFKDGLTHDFGNIPHGSQLYHRFVITNIYAVPLKVTNLRTSCNVCSTVSASPDFIKPKETGYVDVIMDARKFTGPKTIVVHATLGDGTADYNSTARLETKATSRTDIVFNPGSVNFGATAMGKKATQTIDVEYAGQLDWKVTEVSTNDGPFEAAIKELYRKPGRVGYQIAVTLKEDAPAGMLKQEIILKTNDPDSKAVPVMVEANLIAALTVTPEKIKLGSSVKVGDEITRKIIVRGQKPFKVTAVDGLGEGIDLAGKLDENPGINHTLLIKCKPEKEGDMKKTLEIKTDQQDKPLTVIIEGKVEPADK